MVESSVRTPATRSPSPGLVLPEGAAAGTMDLCPEVSVAEEEFCVDAEGVTEEAAAEVPLPLLRADAGVEDALGVKVDDEQAAQMSTVADMVKYIEANQN